MHKIAWAGTAIAFVAALACSGCSEEMPSAVAAISSTSDSYFILGVSPNNMMLQIDEAVIKDKKVTKFVNVLPLHMYGQSAGPYVVVKAKPGAVLAIHSASIMAGHSIFGVLYHPVDETLTFTAPEGKVVYIADITYSFEGRNFHATYNDNLAGAKEFLQIHYPALADRLEQETREIVACPYVCRW